MISLLSFLVFPPLMLLPHQTAAKKISPGQSVNINCSFTFNSTTELLKVKWLKNNTEVDKRVHYNISALRSQNFNSRTVSQTSVLHLPSVQLKDSGTYYCKIWHDVPVLREKISEQGTELRVEKKPKGQNITFKETKTVLCVCVKDRLVCVKCTKTCVKIYTNKITHHRCFPQ
uniref:Ig-like domain-containing protein n=1 Tax=Astyanax mexicanus TaxID=7994 RepID=A0A3B1JWG2_ASTMX